MNLILEMPSKLLIFLDKMLTEKSGLHVHVFQLLPSLGKQCFMSAIFKILNFVLSFVEVEEDAKFMGLVINEKSKIKKIQRPGQQCFPLFSYIMALDFPTINLLR